jgi:hypothetical protein
LQPFSRSAATAGPATAGNGQAATVTATLSNPIGAIIADATATGTIVNDDAPAAPKPRTGYYAGTTSQGRPPDHALLNRQPGLECLVTPDSEDQGRF